MKHFPVRLLKAMQNEHRNAELSADPAAAGADVVECPSCHAALARGLRFCRMCGYRLGEGVEEYAATRRFDGKIPTTEAPPKDTTAGAGPGFQMPHAWGAITPAQPFGAVERESAFKKLTRACNPARFGWVFWAVVIIIMMTIGGAAIKVARNRGAFGGPRVVANAPRPVLGVDGFQTAPTGGAFIEGIDAPGTPVEAAGLIGGDVILNFDGRAIADEDEMVRVLRETPIGKAVEVVFMRDGQTRTTTLTVGSSADSRNGWAAIEARPGGRGQLGISDLDRVRVPNRDIYGVRIGDIDRNAPADLAGMKEGDIVIEFAGQPVRTSGDLRYLIYKAVPGSIVKIVVARGGEEIPLDGVKIGRSK